MSPKADESAMASGPRALLVASDALAARQVTEAFDAAGFEVTHLADLAGLRAALDERPPDVAVLHCLSPTGDVLSAFSAHKAFCKGFVPFVVISPRVTPDEEATALSTGVDVLMHTPFQPTRLTARLSSLLRIKTLHDQLAAANSRLETLSRVDPGTSLYNRRHFFERLEEEFERMRRQNVPLALLMLDVDHFKTANDTHGHVFGDFVLTEVADILRDSIRRIDIVARYGGEEFALILPSTTLHYAKMLADRLRKSIEAALFAKDGAWTRLTVSIGVAEARTSDADNADLLVKRADEALYRAKSKGRNRVEVYSLRPAPRTAAV